MSLLYDGEIWTVRIGPNDEAGYLNIDDAIRYERERLEGRTPEQAIANTAAAWWRDKKERSAGR